MEPSTIVVLVGIILGNGVVALAAWIKSKTDIASILVELETVKIKVKELDLYYHSKNKEIVDNVDKRFDKNELQHGDISDKIDDLVKSLNSFKIEIIKAMK